MAPSCSGVSVSAPCELEHDIDLILPLGPELRDDHALDRGVQRVGDRVCAVMP